MWMPFWTVFAAWVPWMNKSSIAQELAKTGFLSYATTGRSMQPFIRSGKDIVHLRAKKPGERFSKYDVILYRRRNAHKYVLHRIVKVLPDSYVLCGDNCLEKEPGITDEQVYGVLTGITRGGKNIRIHNRGYRFLIRFWYAVFTPRVFVMGLRLRLKRFFRRKQSAQGGPL